MGVGAGLMGLVGLTILGTSFLSGIFGMAGGMILLGVLLALLDVVPAMVLLGVTQIGSNGWRFWLWRAHVRGRIVLHCAFGMLAMFVLLKIVAFVPDKVTVYLGLGLTPFLMELLPGRFRPHVEMRGMPAVCGATIMGVQTFAGVSGSVLDAFFQSSSLDRKEIVATKAAIQSVGHVLRIVYFGSFAVDAGDVLPPAVLVAAVLLALAGTTLASRVLERMSEVTFRRWSRLLILAIGAVFIARGLAMAF
jgi:uncharacterized membrane protein YfcA